MNVVAFMKRWESFKWRFNLRGNDESKMGRIRDKLIRDSFQKNLRAFSSAMAKSWL